MTPMNRNDTKYESDGCHNVYRFGNPKTYTVTCPGCGKQWQSDTPSKYRNGTKLCLGCFVWRYGSGSGKK